MKKCIVNITDLDTSKMDVFAGLDVGYRDPTAFCVIAYDWDDWEYHFNELLDPQKRKDDIEVNLENLKNFTVKARGSEWDSTFRHILEQGS